MSRKLVGLFCDERGKREEGSAHKKARLAKLEKSCRGFAQILQWI